MSVQTTFTCDVTGATTQNPQTAGWFRMQIVGVGTQPMNYDISPAGMAILTGVAPNIKPGAATTAPVAIGAVGP